MKMKGNIILQVLRHYWKLERKLQCILWNVLKNDLQDKKSKHKLCYHK